MCREFSICVLPQRINIYMYHYILRSLGYRGYVGKLKQIFKKKIRAVVQLAMAMVARTQLKAGYYICNTCDLDLSLVLD